uniref:Uncharacterized protein n=1 Tax=Oryza meridionalis TaxID=40149 RepID=A0A0E0E3D5_9ORYZ
MVPFVIHHTTKKEIVPWSCQRRATLANLRGPLRQRLLLLSTVAAVPDHLLSATDPSSLLDAFASDSVLSPADFSSAALSLGLTASRIEQLQEAIRLLRRHLLAEELRRHPLLLSLPSREGRSGGSGVGAAAGTRCEGRGLSAPSVLTAATTSLDVVEAQLRAHPLGGRGDGEDEEDEDDDPKVRLARVEWKLRLDGATNELEDFVGEMEEAVEAEKKARCWAPWRRRCRGAAEVVAGWLRSDPRIKVRLELAVGRLTVTGVYVQGGELLVSWFLDDVTSDGEGIAAFQCSDGGARRQPVAMTTKTTEGYPTKTDASSSPSPHATEVTMGGLRCHDM